MAGQEGTSEGHLVLGTPWTMNHLPGIMSKWLLSISKEWDLTTSLGNQSLALPCSCHQVLIYIDEIPHDSFLLQVELSKLSQPLLIGEVIQSFNHLHGFYLDSLQYVYVFLVLGRPLLDKALWLWPQHWTEREDHITWPAGNALTNAA